MSNILQEIEATISGMKTGAVRSNVGIVRQVGDGVARIEGLSDVMLNEMIEFPGGLYGIAPIWRKPRSGRFSSVKTGRSLKGWRSEQLANCCLFRWARNCWAAL